MVMTEKRKKQRIFEIIQVSIIIGLIVWMTTAIYFNNNTIDAPQLTEYKPDYIMWNGDRYDRGDDGSLHKASGLKDVIQLDDNCNVKDVWEIASYYAKEGNGEDIKRLGDLKDIYNEQGAAVIIENILTKPKDENTDSNTERMEYLIIAGLLAESDDNYVELLNTVLENCFDLDKSDSSHIDIGPKVYKKSERMGKVLIGLRELNGYISNTLKESEEQYNDLIHIRLNIMQLIPVFSALSKGEYKVVQLKSKFGVYVNSVVFPDQNKSHIIKAIRLGEGDIYINYAKYEDSLKIGPIGISKKYKRMNLMVRRARRQDWGKDNVEYDMDFLEERGLNAKLWPVRNAVKWFGLYESSTIIYEVKSKKLESYSYSLYPIYMFRNDKTGGTEDYINDFNTNFSPGGKHEEYAKDIGYDASNPITEENFGERFEDISRMLDEWYK